MRRRPVGFLFIICLPIFASGLPARLEAQPAAQTQPAARPQPAATQNAQNPRRTDASRTGRLPVRRVVLYKSGIGYFEHLGRVTGNQLVSIEFTSAQLNDVLKSLTTLDLGGGRISGINYNSETPFAQQRWARIGPTSSCRSSPARRSRSCISSRSRITRTGQSFRCPRAQ